MTTVVRAAGLVVFRRFSNRVEFLLLQASYPPHHWTPPKGRRFDAKLGLLTQRSQASGLGHVDPGEDEWVAALRETKEESGILQEHLKIYEDCHETLRYEVHRFEKFSNHVAGVVTHYLI